SRQAGRTRFRPRAVSGWVSARVLATTRPSTGCTPQTSESRTFPASASSPATSFHSCSTTTSPELAQFGGSHYAPRPHRPARAGQRAAAHGCGECERVMTALYDLAVAFSERTTGGPGYYRDPA